MQSLEILTIEQVPMSLDEDHIPEFGGKPFAFHADFHLHISASSTDVWQIDDVYMGKLILTGELMRSAADYMEEKHLDEIYDHIRECLDNNKFGEAIEEYKFRRSL